MVQVVIENEADQRGRGRPGDVPQLHRARGRGQPGDLGPDRRRRAGAAQEAREEDPAGRQPVRHARQHRGRQGGAHRRADRHGRRGRRRGQRDLDRRPRHGPEQRAPGAHRASTPPRRCARRSSSSRATRRCRWSTRSPARASTPTSSRSRSRPAPSPTWSGCSATPSIGGGRIAPEPAWVASHIETQHRPDPRHGHLQQVPVPAARGGPPGGPGPRSRRRDPPRGVRRLLLPALHRRLDEAVQPLLRPGARPQRARATSAARSARWTAASSRSSRSGASAGAATGATPTPCTSRWSGSSVPRRSTPGVSAHRASRGTLLRWFPTPPRSATGCTRGRATHGRLPAGTTSGRAATTTTWPRGPTRRPRRWRRPSSPDFRRRPRCSTWAAAPGSSAERSGRGALRDGSSGSTSRRPRSRSPARRGAYDSLEQADLQRPLALEDDSADAVVCVGVMTYLPEVEKVWREFARVARPGGIVVVTQREDLWDDRECQAVVDRLDGRRCVDAARRHRPGALPAGRLRRHPGGRLLLPHRTRELTGACG